MLIPECIFFTQRLHIIHIGIFGMELFHIVAGPDGDIARQTHVFQKVPAGFMKSTAETVIVNLLNLRLSLTVHKIVVQLAGRFTDLAEHFIIIPIKDIFGSKGGTVTPAGFPQGDFPDPAALFYFITLGQIRHNGITGGAEPEQGRHIDPFHLETHDPCGRPVQIHQPDAAIVMHPFQWPGNQRFRPHTGGHRFQFAGFNKRIQNGGLLSGIPAGNFPLSDRGLHLLRSCIRIYLHKCRSAFIILFRHRLDNNSTEAVQRFRAAQSLFCGFDNFRTPAIFHLFRRHRFRGDDHGENQCGNQQKDKSQHQPGSKFPLGGGTDNLFYHKKT